MNTSSIFPEELKTFFEDIKRNKSQSTVSSPNDFFDEEPIKKEMDTYTEEEQKLIKRLLKNDNTESQARLYSFAFDVACIGNDIFKGGKNIANSFEKTCQLGNRIHSEFTSDDKSPSNKIELVGQSTSDLLEWIDHKLDSYIQMVQQQDVI